MPLYLLTCVCDEGVWDTTFKVVEAESRRDIAGDQPQPVGVDDLVGAE